jgi:hypothetical protein
MPGACGSGSTSPSNRQHGIGVERGGRAEWIRVTTVGSAIRRSVTVERQSGLYTVKYRVLSVDGHIVDNRFTFTVKASR